MNSDDRSLILRARAGDERAFDQLVARHGRVVLKVARAVTGRADDADDVAQETFLRFFRSLDRVDPERPLEAWLVTITINVARSHAGRRAARREDGIAGEELAQPSTTPSPHAPLEAADVRAALLLASEELTERERLVFRLRDLQGFDVAVVGDALGITAVTVRRLSGNARAKVVAWLRAHRPELLPGQLGESQADTTGEKK